MTTNNGPARLLRNGGGTNRALRVKAIGTSSNRDAIGAKVRITLDGRAPHWSMVKTGSSYLSQSEMPLTFGLGDAAKVSGIEITWPNGTKERLPGASAGTMITVQEGKGITQNVTLGGK
jgi:hypothetical protein